MAGGSYKYKINLDTVTANRLNEDVVVLWGCTFKEIMGNLIFSYIVSSIVVLPLFTIFGKFYFGMIIDLFIGGAGLFFLSKWMGNLKEGKPRKFYEHIVKLWMMKFGLKQVDRVIIGQQWTVRRMIPINKVDKG